jgi:hypothetical protein
MRLLCSVKFSKAVKSLQHLQTLVPEEFDPIEEMRLRCPWVIQELGNKWKWAHQVPFWFRRHLPTPEGQPGDELVVGGVHILDSVLESELQGTQFRVAIAKIIGARKMMDASCRVLQGLMYLYANADTYLGRRRSMRRGSNLACDVDLRITHSDLERECRVQLKLWACNKKALRGWQYFYYLLINYVLHELKVPPTELLLDSREY